ncbi:hypothetical protein KDW_58740 [Dictyobacter vulcani]|uniref:Uncharacterized protein n=1 Tax=Dictyobacter vulcani TaxID=2607529 RepID=A0A5J4KX50_9CHLR|nr:YCF48-related protein [Dictyobacter vulcani]GER91712.1 hypothetical protein KDW_58740 [Dictyobacter vulcani]
MEGCVAGECGTQSVCQGAFSNDHDAWIAIPPDQQQPGQGITILRTHNGGKSWDRAKINDPLVGIVDTPHFVNDQQGWLEASSTPGAGHTVIDIWHSLDGGMNWTKIASNTDNSGFNMGYVTGLSFRDAQTGIATGNLSEVGDNTIPSILLTQNGGQNWQTVSLPHVLGGYTVSLNISQPPVFFGNLVFLPVVIKTQNGDLLILYRSEDSGMNWVQTTPVPIAAENTYVMDTFHAWATDTQNGKFYRTIDGGKHWTDTSNTPYHLGALSFIDANNGWGIANQTLMHTTDGGKEWQKIPYTQQ